MDLRILPRSSPLPSKAPSPSLALLHEAPTGTLAQLLALRMDSTRRDTLHRMGLVEGLHLRVEHNDHHGRVVIRLGGELFLLGRRETRHIELRILPSPPT